MAMSRSACCGWTYSNIRRLPTCHRSIRVSYDKQAALQPVKTRMQHSTADAGPRQRAKSQSNAAICQAQCCNFAIVQHAQQYACLDLTLYTAQLEQDAAVCQLQHVQWLSTKTEATEDNSNVAVAVAWCCCCSRYQQLVLPVLVEAELECSADCQHP